MSLFNLLSSNEDPQFTLYSDVIDAINKEPGQISGLTREDSKDSVVFYLASRSNRLCKVFNLLRTRRLVTDQIAQDVIEFLAGITEALHGIVKEPLLIELLLSGLQICVSRHPASLRALAAVLSRCGSILERIASTRSGSSIIAKWVTSSQVSAYHVATLEFWTARFIMMTTSCIEQHGLTETIVRWNDLLVLKSSLRALETFFAEKARNSHTTSCMKGLAASANMRVLSNDDKKSSHARPQNTNSYVPELDEATIDLLHKFGLFIPSSERTVQSAIEELQIKETVAILRVVVRGFPCKLCHDAVVRGTRPSNDRAQLPNFELSDVGRGLDSSVMGKQLGVWKVLLSTHAMRRLQHQQHQHQRNIRKKLLDLASGSWVMKLAGSKDQRDKMRIRLAQTICGKDLWLLWQVDIGSADKRQTLQQIIKVWDIVDDIKKIRVVVDRVIAVQQMYSQVTVSRCAQQPYETDNKLSPRQFDSAPAQSDSSMPRLDIRSIDRDIIDMANKFYALTEPVINSVLANDLDAEFPFEIHEDEALTISHFQTASLILGRSGTGKTTCLVFKLVGRYLARRALTGGGLVRQVLLTRSSFLAAKLKTYCGNLIRTLARSSDHLQDESLAPSLSEEPSTLRTVFHLEDRSFPLILTFDEFLTIIENTVAILDKNGANSQEFLSVSKEATIESKQETIRTENQRSTRLIDFYAFKLDYWPRLPAQLTQNVTIELVFAEIMGTIKGSGSSKDSLAPLTRDEYLNRSIQKAPTFALEKERSRVYEIFEKYESLKVQRGDVDYVDRIVKILYSLKKDSILSHRLRTSFDEIYVDEVQDQRCLDIELLLSIIQDPRGLHVAGDTAQAISQDATFRFADIKSLIYEHFNAASSSMNQSELARPITFSLCKNYRSHQGILSLASLIMDMLWRGFPETIDKLNPEVGQLGGPIPLLFLGCGSEILLTNNVGLVDITTSTMDFGAEQVILVRDEHAKVNLQNSIGDAALILTILQSKGMEFDDVILWDFFTMLGSECPGGLRHLHELLEGAKGVFDVKQYAKVCSELKHLYVAITRARKLLLLVESSETACVPVVELLTREVPKPLIEIARPRDADFVDKLKAFQTDDATDPYQWSSRGNYLFQQQSFADALLCFRRAKNYRWIIITRAHLSEEEGRRCGAANDVPGFVQHLQEAVKQFLEVDLVSDAVRNLLRLERFADAANLWLEHKDYDKAAPLFESAKLFDKAAMCYDLGGRFEEAASALRQGNLFDELISYISKNIDRISPDSIRGYGRLCKLLLKQNHLSADSVRLAVEMLGSPNEQEAVFIQYEMDDRLAKLYADQNRNQDLFYVLLRMGQLDEALSAARNSPTACSGAFEDDTVIVLDYVRAGSIQRGHRQAGSNESLHESNQKLLHREQEWDAGIHLFQHDPSQLLSIKDMLIRDFLCLSVTLGYADGVSIPDLNTVPFDIVDEAVKIVTDVLSKPTGDVLLVVLLLVGLFKLEGIAGGYSLLPWSPLPENHTESSAEKHTGLAISWLVDKMSSAILQVDKKLRNLWDLKWPRRCQQVLTTGRCLKIQQATPCSGSHDVVQSIHCRSLLEDCLRINKVFCGLTMVYYRRVMHATFQKDFLGIRRHWLEHLFRTLTYMSSLEQDTSSLVKVQIELFQGSKFTIIANALEELLFRKASKDKVWAQTIDVSSLFEIIQFSQSFGGCVESRLLNVLTRRLFYLRCRVGDLSTVNILYILDELQGDVSRPNASSFQRNLGTFLSALESTNLQQLKSFHAVVNLYEYLISYLIIRIQPKAFITPQSWLDLHFPWLISRKISHPATAMSTVSTDIYQSCFLKVMASFRHILYFLDEALHRGLKLEVGGRPYPSWILSRRNLELLAIAVINIVKSSTQLIGFGKELAATRDFIGTRAGQLWYHTEDVLCEKLRDSFAIYGDKNSLVIITQEAGQRHAFADIQKKLCLKSLSWEGLSASQSASKQAAPTRGSSLTGQAPEKEVRAVEVIRRFWKSRWPKFQDRQSFMQKPMGKIVKALIDLATKDSATLPVRALLVSKGLKVRLGLPRVNGMLLETKKKTFMCVENAVQSIDLPESIEEVLDQLSEHQDKLKDAADKVSDKSLQVFFQNNHLYELGLVLTEVECMLEETEDMVEKARKIVDSISTTTT